MIIGFYLPGLLLSSMAYSLLSAIQKSGVVSELPVAQAREMFRELISEHGEPLLGVSDFAGLHIWATWRPDVSVHFYDDVDRLGPQTNIEVQMNVDRNTGIGMYIRYKTVKDACSEIHKYLRNADKTETPAMLRVTHNTNMTH